MCDGCNRTDAVNSGIAGQGQVAGGYAESAKKMADSTFRERLEGRRNQLTRQLAQIESALQVLYTVPDAERIASILKQANL